MFADNFAYYGLGGAGNTNMLLGLPWLEATAAGPSASNPRPNGTHSYVLSATVGGVPGLRCGFGADWTTFFLARCIRPTGLPSASNVFYIFQPRTSGNVEQCTVTVGATGTVSLRTGGVNGAIIATSAAPVIAAGGFYYCEAKFTIDGAVGTFQLRINETVVLNVSNVNTAGAGGVVAAADAMRILGGEVFTCDVYDWSQRNAGEIGGDPFLGDMQWLTRKGSADTAQTDWVRNTGANDFSAIADAVQDGDTTYLEASTPGDKSDFTHDALPGTVSEVIGVILRPIWKKTLAGTSTARAALLSGVAVANGATKSLGTAYAYDFDSVLVDPATGVAWTPSGYNAAKLRIEKVA